MIFSNDCFVKDTCKKFKEGNCSDNEFCLKLFKLDFLYRESLLTDEQRKKIPLRVDADGTDKDKFTYLKTISDNIEWFVKEGNNLFIYSSICGNGKTLWAIRMIQSYFNSIWHKCDLNCKALFINVPRFLLQLKDGISNNNEYINHIKQNILKADIVVWDDIATKSATSFEHENLLSMIDMRFNDNKSNIFTSNIHPEEIYQYIGERLASRIVGYSINVELNGKDKRGI